MLLPLFFLCKDGISNFYQEIVIPPTSKTQTKRYRTLETQ